MFAERPDCTGPVIPIRTMTFRHASATLRQEFRLFRAIEPLVHLHQQPRRPPMRIDHRDLHDDFPEYAQRIHDLKVGNARFGELFKAYDEINHKIRRIELDNVRMGDAEFERLKYERLSLKDKLYAMLKG
jgi:uncharacterized protein